MSPLNQLARWVPAFLMLNLYVNGLPRLFQFEVLHWFAYWAGFFVLLFVVCRYLLGIPSLLVLAMPLTGRGLSQLVVGFGLGLGLWALKYGLFWATGKFSFGHVADASFYLPMIGQALLAMFFAALLNDISIRGYWYVFFRRQGLLGYYVLFATLLYGLDDAWNEGFSLMNTSFSVLLGLSLAYAVYKTGALWLCTGIHWGSNMMYRLLFGFTGQGVWQLEGVQEGLLYESISLLVTALLFPILYLLIGKGKFGAPKVPDKAAPVYMA